MTKNILLIRSPLLTKIRNLFSHSFKLILFLLIFVNGALSANAVGDDITTELKYKLLLAKSDTARINSMNDISSFYRSTNLDSSLIYAKKAYRLSKNSGYKLEKTAVVIANVYCMLDDYLNSNIYLIEAFNEARKFENTRQYSSIYNSMGTNYLMLNDLDNAKKYFALAYEYSYNYRSRFTTIQNLGQAYMYDSEYLKANEYFGKALKLALEENNQRDIVKIYNRLGELNYIQKEFIEGLFYYKKVLEMNIEDNDYINAVNMECIAKSYLAIGKFNEGIKMALYADSISEQNGIMDNQIELSHDLSLLYDSIKRPDLALKYYKRYSALKDSLFNIEKQNKISSLNIEFETTQKELQIESLEQESKYRKTLNYVYLIIGGLSLLVLFTIIRSFKQRNRILALKKEKLEKQNESEIIKKKKLEFELFEKDREILMYVMQINQQKEVLTGVQAEIESIIQHNKPEMVLKSVKQLNSNIVTKIKLSDDWVQIKLHFEKIHPSFFSKLQEEYFGLTINEQKLCAYTKLKFSIKEISRLLNVNPESVQVSRYRLKKKLGIPEEMNFDDFIDSR